MNFVPPDQLDAVWHLVVPGLVIVRQKTREAWNQDDVRRSLNNGQARLYIRSEGFLILEHSVECWTGKPFVNVWIAWFKPQSAKAIKSELVAFLDQFPLWKFSSPRLGWALGLEEYVEVERVVYRRKK